MLKNKFVLLAFGFLAAVVLFFLFNASYRLSFEARMNYFLGDYQKATKLAEESFALNPQNHMASAILLQSRSLVGLLDYVEDAKTYLKQIDDLTKSSAFSPADKVKIKYYCELMMHRYHQFNPAAMVMIDQAMYEKCTKQYAEFKKIHDALF